MADEKVSVQVPMIYASGFSVSASGTDVKLLLTDYSPLGDESTPAAPHLVGVIALSLHAAKDLAILLGDVVASYEVDYGVISTPYIKSRSNPAGK